MAASSATIWSNFIMRLVLLLQKFNDIYDIYFLLTARPTSDIIRSKIHHVLPDNKRKSVEKERITNLNNSRTQRAFMLRLKACFMVPAFS